MKSFSACGACARYMRSAERACPFCGVLRNVQRDVQPVGATSRARPTSRAAWLARGSALALVGCTSGATAGPPSGADATAVEASSVTPEASLETSLEASATDSVTPPADSGDASDVVASDAPSEAPFVLADAEAAGDAAVEASPTVFTCPDAGAFALKLGQGEFECAEAGTYRDVYGEGGVVGTVVADASLFCDRATQYCQVVGSVSQCGPLGQLCVIPSGGIGVESLRGSCDSGAVSCACGDWSDGYCTDDDAGGLTVHAPCYGAPPGRLERLARHSSGVA